MPMPQESELLMSKSGSTTGADSTRLGHHDRQRVVIVGAGFAGLAAAKALAAKPWYHPSLHVTLIDQHNHHVVTPFLYEVVTGQRGPSGSAYPIRSLVSSLGNVDFFLATATGINVSLHQVDTDRGPVPYDYLILAAGAVPASFEEGDGADSTGLAMGLGDLADAEALRNHVLSRLEALAWTTDPAERSRLLRFVVVGGGPTGVELAAALAVLTEQLAGPDFPGIDPSELRIVLVEATAEVLPASPADVRVAATRSLQEIGVEVATGTTVTHFSADGVTFADGRDIEAATVIRATGVQASPLAATLPATGSHARAIVSRTLQVERHPQIFVVGDMAEIPGDAGPHPMVAQVAIQSGRQAARSIVALCAHEEIKPFRYRDLGTAVIVGRTSAVAKLGRLHVFGRKGWAAWLGIQAMCTVGLRSKEAVVLSGVSRQLFPATSGRLITATDRSEQTVGKIQGSRTSPPAAAIRAKVDLPSVNVANANRWGRAAALAWWGQAYPGLKPEPEQPHGVKALRRRVVKVRHEVTGNKSQTDVNERG